MNRLVWSVLFYSSAALAAPDVIIRHAQVVDGTGNAPFVADVAIEDGKITAVGKVDEVGAARVIDAQGLVIAPGFIDLHTHSDAGIVAPLTRANINYLTQGCTSIVTGNCGSGPTDVATYLAKIDAAGAGTHVMHLLPQGSLRDRVMGRARRAATADELNEMLRLAEQAMRDGAFGMSTGLIYVPSMYADTAEIAAIAKVVAQQQGLYVSHIRGEGSELLDSVREALAIGQQSEAAVHISHFKASGKHVWGTLRLAGELIEQARGKGQRVTADQYPYTASSTSLEATVLPGWAREGGRKELERRLNDDTSREKILQHMRKQFEHIHRLQIVACRWRPEWVGKMFDELASSDGLAELAIEIERHGGAGIINYGMHEDDVRYAMQLPWVATASDGSAKIMTSEQPHPRSFGTFSRKVGRYAIEDNVVTLAHAVRSASGLPADILGLTDRGYIKPGLAADLVVFDPDTFRDRATFEQPYHYSSGVKYVFVDGVSAVHEGVPTGALAGRALRKHLPSTPKAK